MSFQGDVRGIGLGELLQGLSRGRKEGILTLTTSEGARRTLGVEEGLIYLLPEPAEDAEVWRDRVRDAWASQADFRVDYLRMSEIAKADRLERLYDLIDGGGASFRFDPGTLPNRSMGAEAEQADTTEVYCEGVSAEFLLLEYARLGDELGGAPGAHSIEEGDMPLLLDAAGPQRSKLLAQCDGNSTVREISDRLAWPLRQTRLTLFNELQRGAVRLATASELLMVAFQELANQNFSRGAKRLSAWAINGQPGPVSYDQAEMFNNEWLAGRLPVALEAMSARAVRTLLRRLDHALHNISASVMHWREAARLHPDDLTIRMHCLAVEAREAADPEVPSIDELLALAREFRQKGVPHRAGPALVLAAHMQPSSEVLQFEIGQGLVAAGRADEGAPWLLTAARSMLDRGAADRVLAPLRALLDADPGNRECRELLGIAKRTSTKTRKLRKNLLIGLGITSVVSAVAVVRVRAEQDYRNRIHEVRTALGDPDDALLTLESNFPEDGSEEIVALRTEIRERQTAIDAELHKQWTDLYREAQAACTLGDPCEGLILALDLPNPPVLRTIDEPWPLRTDLYRGLIESLSARIADLGPPVEASSQQVGEEELALRQITKMTEALAERPEAARTMTEFGNELDALATAIRGRIEERTRRVKERLYANQREDQDRLLAEARELGRRGEFQRALRKYDELLLTDSDGKVRHVLGPEMDSIVQQDDAVKEARALASAGEHDRAFDVLKEKFEDPESFLLPWHVDSDPSGATVHLENGTERTTPFVIETTFADSMVMRFELEGFDSIEWFVERPSDQRVPLSRTPNRRWASSGRVDALPVSLGEDHLFADRQGRLARVGAEGTVWEVELPTLSGIARAPVHLPQRPGYLLLVTEDGQAWIVDEQEGNPEGPWPLNAAPSIGPYPTPDSVRLMLRNNSVASWKIRLKPVIQNQTGIDPSLAERFRNGSESGLAVLRRRERRGDDFASPWSDWRVTIGDAAFLVTNGQDSYSITREGPWEYLAWEAPGAKLPRGRLWISDAYGVRAFTPH